MSYRLWELIFTNQCHIDCENQCHIDCENESHCVIRFTKDCVICFTKDDRMNVTVWSASLRTTLTLITQSIWHWFSPGSRGAHRWCRSMVQIAESESQSQCQGLCVSFNVNLSHSECQRHRRVNITVIFQSQCQCRVDVNILMCRMRNVLVCLKCKVQVAWHVRHMSRVVSHVAHIFCATWRHLVQRNASHLQAVSCGKSMLCTEENAFYSVTSAESRVVRYVSHLQAGKSMLCTEENTFYYNIDSPLSHVVNVV